MLDYTAQSWVSRIHTVPCSLLSNQILTLRSVQFFRKPTFKLILQNHLFKFYLEQTLEWVDDFKKREDVQIKY